MFTCYCLFLWLRTRTTQILKRKKAGIRLKTWQELAFLNKRNKTRNNSTILTVLYISFNFNIKFCQFNFVCDEDGIAELCNDAGAHRDLVLPQRELLPRHDGHGRGKRQSNGRLKQKKKSPMMTSHVVSYLRSVMFYLS